MESRNLTDQVGLNEIRKVVHRI